MQANCRGRKSVSHGRHDHAKISALLCTADVGRNLYLIAFKCQGQSRHCWWSEQHKEKKKHHIWQRRCLATGSAFSPIFHDTQWTLNARRHRSVCVCVCVRACANKYLLTSPHEENVRFVCELTARPHTLPLSINYNKQKRFPHSCTYDKTCPLKPALIRNHRPESSCLLQHLKCNYSGCSLPACCYNSQEITLSAVLFTQNMQYVNQYVCRNVYLNMTEVFYGLYTKRMTDKGDGKHEGVL